MALLGSPNICQNWGAWGCFWSWSDRQRDAQAGWLATSDNAPGFFDWNVSVHVLTCWIWWCALTLCFTSGPTSNGPMYGLHTAALLDMRRGIRLSLQLFWWKQFLLLTLDVQRDPQQEWKIIKDSEACDSGADELLWQDQARPHAERCRDVAVQVQDSFEYCWIKFTDISHLKKDRWFLVNWSTVHLQKRSRFPRSRIVAGSLLKVM